MKVVSFWVILSFSLISCTIRDQPLPEKNIVQPPAYHHANLLINEGQGLVKEGDLVLRSGTEFTSQFVKQFSKDDQTYSHAGIIFFENGYPYVYHLVPGDENTEEKFRKDSLLRFCDPQKNLGYAIYRYNIDSTEKKKFRGLLEGWFKKGVRFDSEFDYKTDNKMYCSEMIKKGLERATANRVVINTTQPTKPQADLFVTHLKKPASTILKMKIVAMDNLFINPHCRLIKRFDFNPQK